MKAAKSFGLPLVEFSPYTRRVQEPALSADLDQQREKERKPSAHQSHMSLREARGRCVAGKCALEFDDVLTSINWVCARGQRRRFPLDGQTAPRYDVDLCRLDWPCEFVMDLADLEGLSASRACKTRHDRGKRGMGPGDHRNKTPISTERRCNTKARRVESRVTLQKAIVFAL